MSFIFFNCHAGCWDCVYGQENVFEDILPRVVHTSALFGVRAHSRVFVCFNTETIGMCLRVSIEKTVQARYGPRRCVCAGVFNIL